VAANVLLGSGSAAPEAGQPHLPFLRLIKPRIIMARSLKRRISYYFVVGLLAMPLFKKQTRPTVTGTNASAGLDKGPDDEL
jgi:hypothetical protein